MSISVLKRGFFNSIFRVCRIEVSRQHLNNDLTLLKKSFSGQKTDPPQPPAEAQCTDATAATAATAVKPWPSNIVAICTYLAVGVTAAPGKLRPP